MSLEAPSNCDQSGDTMRRFDTSSPASKLSVRQEQALERLLLGDTVSAVAKGVGVSRQTVHRWLREPEFASALAALRNDLFAETEIALERIATSALRNVETAVVGGDLATSIAVLKGLGFLNGVARWRGSEDPNAIRAQQLLDARISAHECRREELFTEAFRIRSGKSSS